MLIRPLRDFPHEGRKHTPKDIVDVLDYHGQELIRMGLAVEVKGAAEIGAAHPTRSPAEKFQTGPAQPALSSPAVPARPNAKFRRKQKRKLSP